jgi:hypothetical protein
MLVTGPRADLGRHATAPDLYRPVASPASSLSYALYIGGLVEGGRGSEPGAGGFGNGGSGTGPGGGWPGKGDGDGRGGSGGCSGGNGLGISGPLNFILSEFEPGSGHSCTPKMILRSSWV